ncbi:MAG: succinylglutamate desuccinylase/aspartoacylase family protein [Planctomycetes bacterium]|nr:succinylglutamate desuccinylase/aspartoacylase family protein [Planctomycetota bacterium]
MRAPTLERVLGSVATGERGGPLVLVTVGIHGNEPAGLHAMRRVLRRLQAVRAPLEGRIAAFVGNRAGLERNVRFVDEDLNRLWAPARVEDLRRSDPRRDNVERAEQRELLELLESELDAAEGHVTHLDLHSTSGAGPPFTVAAGPPPSRAAALRLGVPTILGLEPLVAGTLIDFVGSLGHAAVVLEGGQNESALTIDHHEAAVWVTLVGAGVLRADDVPGGLATHSARLASAALALPPAIVIEHVHRLQAGAAFEMLPGFQNFQAVAQGELLAREGPGLQREVRAPWAGLLVMPRYQGQGLDGFFLGRPAGGAPAHATATVLG